MRKICIVVFCLVGFNSAWAVFFGMDGYVIEKNDINKYSKSVYGLYIDYALIGPTKQSLTNNCIIQKDTSANITPECQRDKSGNLITSYLKMRTLINVQDNTTCILNIMFYDRSDVLLQTRELTTFEGCQWAAIPQNSSVDKARLYILKIDSMPAATTESK